MSKPLIYVIDDETDYLQLVHYVFVEFLAQYTIILFPSGETMLKSLETDVDRPALVLLDLYMPGMDGQHVLRKLKSKLEWKLIPVVMVTSETEPGEIQACYQAGANSCLAKPTGIESMKMLFKKVCAYWVDTSGNAIS